MKQFGNSSMLATPVKASILLGACIALAWMATGAEAVLTITTGDTVMCDRTLPANLIVNGSFEAGNPLGTNYGWTPGSHLGGYPGVELPIPAWVPSWPSGAYGWWGSLGFAGAPPADGVNYVYFGNNFNTAGVPVSSIGANGVITFAGTPTFSGRPGPVTLSQTVAGLSTSSTYRLEFFTSGESNTSGFTGTGLFGLDITGEPTTYLLLPASSNSFGASERYYVDFVPSASAVTIKFSNWGHITDIAGTATELVLDDVCLNRIIPEPTSIALLGLGCLGVMGVGRRRKTV